jgi:hypothetical protein
VWLVSLYEAIPEMSPDALSCTATEVICVNEQAMMVFWNLREAATRESEHFIGAKPTQAAVLHPLNCIYPIEKCLAASLPAPPLRIRQREVVGDVPPLYKLRSR